MLARTADSTVITLSDWYHIAAKLNRPFPYVFMCSVVLDRRFSHYAVRPSDSTLINGLGRSTGTPDADLAVISVTQGKR